MPERREKGKRKIGEIFVYEPTGERTTLQSGDSISIELHEKFFLVSFHRKTLNGTDRLLFNNGENKWYMGGDKYIATDIVVMIIKIYDLRPQTVEENKNRILYKLI